jgi:chromosome segregation ATPase
VRTTELARYKEQTDKMKRKVKEMEEENETLHDKLHLLKKEKSDMEQLLLINNGASSSGGVGGTDFEKEKLKEMVVHIEAKLDKKRIELRR